MPQPLHSLRPLRATIPFAPSIFHGRLWKFRTTRVVRSVARATGASARRLLYVPSCACIWLPDTERLLLDSTAFSALHQTRRLLARAHAPRLELPGSMRNLLISLVARRDWRLMRFRASPTRQCSSRQRTHTNAASSSSGPPPCRDLQQSCFFICSTRASFCLVPLAAGDSHLLHTHHVCIRPLRHLFQTSWASSIPYSQSLPLASPLKPTCCCTPLLQSFQDSASDICSESGANGL